MQKHLLGFVVVLAVALNASATIDSALGVPVVTKSIFGGLVPPEYAGGIRQFLSLPVWHIKVCPHFSFPPPSSSRGLSAARRGVRISHEISEPFLK